MNDDIIHLEQTIAHLEQTIVELAAKQADVTNRRNMLAALTAQKALDPLDPALTDKLEACLDALQLGIEAENELALKRAALAQLMGQLDHAKGTLRRTKCEDVALQFDRTHASYTNRSQELLATFRRLFALHLEYQALTGRDLLHEADYRLNLPATRSPGQWPSHISTGMEVRS